MHTTISVRVRAAPLIDLGTSGTVADSSKDRLRPIACLRDSSSPRSVPAAAVSSIRIDLASLSECCISWPSPRSQPILMVDFPPRSTSATSTHLFAVSPTDCVLQLQLAKPHTFIPTCT